MNTPIRATALKMMGNRIQNMYQMDFLFGDTSVKLGFKITKGVLNYPIGLAYGFIVLDLKAGQGFVSISFMHNPTFVVFVFEPLLALFL